MEEKTKSNFTIIEDTDEAKDKYGHNYGSDTQIISVEDLDALLHGKVLATEINGGEYTLFIKLNSEKEIALWYADDSLISVKEVGE